MTIRYLFILPVFLLFASCQPNEPSTQSTLSKNLDSLLQTVPDFSGVVLVAENGNALYHKAYGYRRFAEKNLLEENDIFELASVSKQFTAMIIMMLKEEGKLEYDDFVEKYIPDLPYPGITIRHLLHHTSGLPDYQAVMDEHWDKSKVAGNDDNIAYLIQYHPERRFAPGEKYEYSNTGYMFLATIAEKASERDFIELSRQRIFVPLKMTQTDIRTREDKLKLTEMAWGHLYVPEKQTYVHADSFPAFNYAIWLGNRKGPGRVSGSALDLLKWDRALYSESLIKEETLEDAFTPARLNNGTFSPYGFGWNIRQHPQLGKKVYHTGDNPGYKSIIIRYIDSRKTLILLCNNAHEKYDEMVRKIESEMGK
ncbi:MAG: serine hydrolase domain-containing protein [Cyclobacteriaceae bacterium]